MAVASKAVTTALEPLIRELINAQEAQNAELEELRQEVRRLIDGPWRLSILHLRASESAGSADPARRSAELEKAAEALLQAYSLHPDASATRALIAADLSMVEGLIGRRKDAAGWADTAYDDVTAFLRQQAPSVQEALNDRPPLLRRVRSVVDGSIWDDVLGIGNGVPAPAADSAGESINARIATAAVLRRELLERGPGAAPGWSAFSFARAGSQDPPDLWWDLTKDAVSRTVYFSESSLPHVRALVELHAAASRAETFRQVCAQFSQREQPAYQLVVRLQRRYDAEVSYAPCPRTLR